MTSLYDPALLALISSYSEPSDSIMLGNCEITADQMGAISEIQKEELNIGQFKSKPRGRLQMQVWQSDKCLVYKISSSETL
jgi:hypothetical protein